MTKNYILGHSPQIKNLDLLAKQNRIPNSLIFTGINGIGKKKIATQFIKKIFCENENSPCEKCRSCIQINSETFPDFIILSPNEKGNIPIGKPGKNEEGTVRWLIQKLSMSSIYGKTCVIIDGVDKINQEGQNALLKTIEEPKKGTYIFLIASSRSQILPTILSRSMEIHFNPLKTDEVVTIIKKMDVADAQIETIAFLSGGSVESTLLLQQESLMQELLHFAEEIAQFITEGKQIENSIKNIEKKIDMDFILLTLSNLFRATLLEKLDGKKSPVNLPLLKQLSVEQLRKTIKILNILPQGMANNINIQLTLKSLLYSIDDISNLETINLFNFFE